MSSEQRAALRRAACGVQLTGHSLRLGPSPRERKWNAPTARAAHTRLEPYKTTDLKVELTFAISSPSILPPPGYIPPRSFKQAQKREKNTAAEGEKAAASLPRPHSRKGRRMVATFALGEAPGRRPWLVQTNRAHV